MAAPTLGDYEYQFKDTGVKLNSSVSATFVDITKITGLDMPQVDSITADFDGVHGGSVYSKFFGTRTFVLDGFIYAPAASADAYCDTLVTNFMPDDIDWPFYFKGAGISQRYILAKSLGLKYDIDSLRMMGKTAAQFILAAGDVRKYVNNADQVMVANTLYTPTNAGNMETYPVFTIIGAWSTITLFNSSASRTVALADTRIAGDVTVVDFKTRSVTVNGVRKSSIVTTNQWWSIPAGGGQSVRYTVTGGPPTSVTMATKQGWA